MFPVHVTCFAHKMSACCPASRLEGSGAVAVLEGMVSEDFLMHGLQTGDASVRGLEDFVSNRSLFVVRVCVCAGTEAF